VGGEGPFLLLSVEDEGSGIPDQQKEAIFEKFHQVEGQARIRGQGVGLGLAISQKIVHGHSGAIWVDDRPGGGAIFRVLLPTAPQAWEGEPPSSPPTGAHRRIALTGDTMTSPGSSSRREATSAGAATILALLLTTVGCTPLPWYESPAADPSPSPLPPSEAPATSEDEVVPSATIVVAEWLEVGFQKLEWKAFAEAAYWFERVIEVASVGSPERNEARWALALTRLLPASPLYNVDQGTTLLRILAEEAPESAFGVQATLFRQALLDNSEARRQLRGRDTQIEDLTRALELYRRIDQERRPSP
jgi:hypothetical protein